jgi:superfamily II DNA or RNA helicase
VLCASRLNEQKDITFTLVVVPTVALKGDAEAGFLGEWHRGGLELTPVLKDAKGWPHDFNGAVITYQQLLNIVGTVETWCSLGMRLFIVFDEIHHVTESNQWGAAAERLGRCATKILALTGTPFRGDGRRISFVNYNAAGEAVADDRYRYREAVRDNVCRPVSFMTDDGIAEFISKEIEEAVRISEPETEESESGAAKTIFRGDSQWLRTVIERADAKLDEYRSWDVDAGGLVICRPGNDEFDDKHLRGIAKLVAEVSGEEPEVVGYEDPDATAKIERFRKSRKRWICAVRKISEGVDIKRLRVLVLANRPTTELLFRQVVGRVVRVDDPNNPGDATVYQAKFPQLVEWSKRIQEDAVAGLNLREPKPREPGDPREPSSFIPGQTTHEQGGAISDFGEEYSAAEINAAERIKDSEPSLSPVPITSIAQILRRAGVVPDPQESPGDPLHIQKKNKRRDLVKAARRLALQTNPTEPDYGAVFSRICRTLNVRSLDDMMDNHSLAIMDQALELVTQWLVNSDAAA